ncbi:hypothetical protein LMG18090_04514 [Ralstonia mannitolilytica]|nr:hypothetical protein LMG18090_04514 [Ralstonia mannitolilytica]
MLNFVHSTLNSIAPSLDLSPENPFSINRLLDVAWPTLTGKRTAERARKEAVLLAVAPPLYGG